MVAKWSNQDLHLKFIKNPKHPYTQGLLKSIPTLHGDPPTFIKGIPPSLLNPPTECRFIERCPLAFEKCKQLPPKFKTKTGYVQCWLYEDEAISTQNLNKKYNFFKKSFLNP